MGDLDAMAARKLTRAILVMKCSKPREGVVKLNFDGAFDVRTHRSVSSVVARNAMGKVVRSRTIFHEHVTSAFDAEALVCFQAMKLGIDEGWDDIIVENDTLSIIKKWQAQASDKSLIGVHIQNIHHLQNRLKKIHFQFTPRSANGFAHILTTTTLKEGKEYYLRDSILDFSLPHLDVDFECEPD